MFTPAIPLGGVAGWRFLQATEEAQREAFAASTQISREASYFRENIAGAETAQALVADRTLLTVALGAFGLEADIDKRAYVQRVLEDGTTAEGAFANRLVDGSYRQLAATFGYGDPGGATVALAPLMEDLAERHVERAFEAAVGGIDNDLRLSMNFFREIGELAGTGLGDDAFWFRVLGDVPLRTVLEGALGLPSEFGALDVDRQAETLREKARSELGVASVADFEDPDVREAAIQRFLVRREAQSGPSAGTPGYAAIQLLNAGAGSGVSGGLLSTAL